MTTDASPAGELLSIGTLARLAGVPVETLRMWERRYGRPAARRLPSGHRRYDASQVPHLRRVAEAVAHGVRPSAAVVAAPEDLDSLLAARRPREASAPKGWLAPVRSFDAAALRAWFAAEAAPRAPTAFVADVVGPLVAAVGRAWADGRLDVRHEHFASGVVLDELRARQPGAGAPARAPRLVVATLPGDRHGLGAAMAAHVAAHAGAVPVFLGADTPVAEIASAAREAGAPAVAVSVSIARGGIDADRALAELRALLPARVQLVVGGAGSRRPGRPRPGTTRMEDFDEFAAWMAAIVGAERGPNLRRAGVP